MSESQNSTQVKSALTISGSPVMDLELPEESRSKSSYLEKLGYLCTGLAEFETNRSEPNVMVVPANTDYHSGSPLPGERWYGSPSRMSISDILKRPKNLVEESDPVTEEVPLPVDIDVEDDNSIGDENQCHKVEEILDEKEVIKSDTEDKQKEVKAQEQFGFIDSDVVSNTDVVSNASSTKKRTKSPRYFSMAVGTLLGMGTGLSMALPFLYYFTTYHSQCYNGHWYFR